MALDRYLLKPEINEVHPVSESTRFRQQAEGTFPQYERIGARRVGIRESHILRWLNGERSGWKVLSASPKSAALAEVSQ